MPVHYLPALPPACTLDSFDKLPCSPKLPFALEGAIAVALPQAIQVDRADEVADIAIPAFLTLRLLVTSTAPPAPVLLQLPDARTGRLREIPLGRRGDYLRPDDLQEPPPKAIAPMLRTTWHSFDLAGLHRFGVGRHEVAFRCGPLHTPRLTFDVRVAG